MGWMMGIGALAIPDLLILAYLRRLASGELLEEGIWDVTQAPPRS
jgi:hypothetical protein